MNKILFFLIFLFNSPILFSQTDNNLYDFIFPLKLSPNFTSNFGEYRSNHLHAGIDISTNHKTGIEVVATRNGYIENIQVSPNGYGKLIQIKHSDGYTSFYAHLKNFPVYLENLILKKQKEINNYSIELNFNKDELIVEKGDVIAFSGESGAGGPHLHFEIFDENNFLINPLIFPNIRNFIDNTPPQFSSFVVMPLSENTFIGHNLLPAKFIPKKINSTKYKINEIIHINGSVGFGVEIIDFINDRDDRLSQKILTFKIDNREILVIEKNIQKQNQSREVSLFYDFDLVNIFNDKIQKLFVDENVSLSFYKTSDKGKGIISLDNFSNGFHDFEIIAEDYLGNKSQLEGTFLLTTFPKFSILNHDEKEITIRTESQKNVSFIETSFFSDKNKSWTNLKYPIDNKQVNIFSIPFFNDNSDLKKISIHSTDGSSSFPVFFSNKNIEATISINPIFYRDNIFIELSSNIPLTSSPSAILSFENKTIPLNIFAIESNKYIIAIPKEIDKQFTFKIFYKSNNINFANEYQIFTNKTISNQPSFLTSLDKTLQFKIQQGSIQSDAIFLINKISENKYNIKHTAGVFKNGITVNYKLSKKELSTKNLALYSGSNGSWNFITNKINFENNSFQHQNPRTITGYSILTDDENPQLNDLKINPFYNDNSWLFQFSLKDNLSGISTNSIIVKLDGQRIFPDYDTEKEKVLYFPLNRITTGKHTLTISAEDNVGNKVSLKKSFKLIF